MSGLCLWAGSVQRLDFDQRLEAARVGGFDSTSLFPYEVFRARAAGISDAELRARFEDAGVRVAVIDPLARWLPTWRSPGELPADDPAHGNLEPDEVFAMAVAFGADLISVLALYDPPVPVELGGPAFAELCDRAAEHGLRLQLEFIPGTGIHDLAAAWDIVQAADRPNGGILLDTWHFFRSDSSFELLGALPADRIFSLQIEDAPAAPPADPAHESLHGRLLPGDGGLDLERFIAAIADKLPALVGPEVFSDELGTLPAAELGRRLGESTRAVLPG
ncbi:MAG: sugar phosphate isomerase/epimerase [Solirubrobacterales bacterium]